jgi:type III restriction enzyme
MALHKDFPDDPHSILAPSVHWFPADESLRKTTMDKLMPPLVPALRRKVAVGFKLDCVTADGGIPNYYPDFIVKLPGNRVVIVETKGQEDMDVGPRMARLKQWCEDVSHAGAGVAYDFVYVDEESFKEYAPKGFASLLASFRKFK